MQSSLTGLAERLVSSGLLTAHTAQTAQQSAQAAGLPFLSYLLKQKTLTPTVLALAAAEEFGLSFVDLNNFSVEQMPTQRLPLALLRRYRVLPLAETEHYLQIAISDPSNLQALDEIKFTVGLAIQWVLVADDQLQAALTKLQGQQEPTVSADFAEAESAQQAKQPAESIDTSDAPLVHYVQEILLMAISKGASDLHFETYEKDYRIRFRVDGVLYIMARPPLNMAGRIAARLKVLAKLDVAERRLPQDGRFKIQLDQRSIDFRMSTCPTLFGEKVVLRLLDAAHDHFSMDQLGLSISQQELLLAALKKPQGMILVTGPTGSGKTATLYTALKLLNTPDLNISTVEDPIEINLPGINQVPVNLKVGLSFATALRAFLRQDPDIIMVGEIRDLETAEIAIKAAQTGHLVLSTVHTNSAADTLNRLLNMGVAAFDAASALTLIIAQRLCRRLCHHCRELEQLPQTALIAEGFKEIDLENLMLYRANTAGCPHCTAGYQGRIGLYEILPITATMARLIMAGSNALDIAAKAEQEGMLSLRQAGLLQVQQGSTSLAELHRIISI